jgi:acyl carrier protein
MSADAVKEQDLARVMALVCETGHITAIAPDDDFYDAGFTSLTSLDLLLQLEAEWDVSIPDEEFIVARSARSLGALITRLKEGVPCD